MLLSRFCLFCCLFRWRLVARQLGGNSRRLHARLPGRMTDDLHQGLRGVGGPITITRACERLQSAARTVAFEALALQARVVHFVASFNNVFVQLVKVASSTSPIAL